MRKRWSLILALILSACHAQTTAIPSNAVEIHPELKNVPVYSKSAAWTAGIPGVETPEGYEVYSYLANVFKSETLVSFYEDTMPSYGWELFSNVENEIGNIKGTTLLFSKGETIAKLEIIEWTATSKLVSVNFYSSP